MQSRKLVRTLVMATASLALVVVLYSVYQYSESRSAPRRVATPSPVQAPSPTPRATASPASDGAELRLGKEQIAIKGGEGVRLTFALRGGGTRGQLNAEEWRPIAGTNNTFEIKAPDLRLRRESGQRIRITGQTGTVVLKSASMNNPQPKSFHLVGTVRIVVDPLTAEQREQLPEPQRDRLDSDHMITLVMDELFFDLEYARIETAGPFTIEAPEFSIAGTGIHLHFNELENRIEELLIDKGQSIEVRGLSKNLAMNFEMSEEDEAPVSKAPEKTTAETLPPENEMPPDGIPYLESSIPRNEKPKRSPTDVYTAVFEDDVRVQRRAGESVLGRLEADRLTVLFDFGRRERDLASAGATPTPPASPSESDDDEPKDTPPPESILLTWSGPLRVVSKREKKIRPPAAPQRVQITAEGEAVHVEDEDRDITCTRLVYHNESKLIQLFGQPEKPAVVVSQSSGEVRGTEILLDRTGGGALVKGPGGRLLSREKPVRANPLLGKNQNRGFDVRFEGSLQATFTQETHAKTDPQTGETHTRRRPVLTSAVIENAVDMRHGGERIRCDRIEIDFEQGQSRQPQPAQARAFGHVVATEGQRYISATDRLFVEMAYVEVAKAPWDLTAAKQFATQRGRNPEKIDWDAERIKYESKKNYRPGLRRMRAWGEVEVRDPHQGVDIACAALDCTFKEGRFIESGLVKPASGQSAYVAMGEFSIASSQPIPFDVDRQTASVDGPGRMTFLTEKGLDGGTLKEPTLVSIKWARRMAFDGLKNEAVFAGEVNIESPDSAYDCENLRIDFEDAVKPEPAPLEAATARWWILTPLVENLTHRSGRKQLATLDLAGPSLDKDVVHIYATGSVVATNSRTDEKTGKLTRRVLIKGPTMAVDLREEYVTVEGAGNLLIEDYELAQASPASPRRKNPKPRTSPFGRAMRNEPSQTFVAWENSMTYRFGRKVADFQKNVSLVHRTGQQMFQAKRILGDAAEAVGKNAGSKSTLNCQSLVVEFLRHETQDRLGAGSMSGYDVQAFNASGQVHFFDSGISAIAQQITYTREDNVLQILGTQKDPAQLFDQRKRFSEMRGPRFEWDRARNRILAPRSRGTVR